VKKTILGTIIVLAFVMAAPSAITQQQTARAKAVAARAKYQKNLQILRVQNDIRWYKIRLLREEVEVIEAEIGALKGYIRGQITAINAIDDADTKVGFDDEMTSFTLSGDNPWTSVTLMILDVATSNVFTINK
jgi:type II secretory pathway pseudopilin PulG